jgi:hypothetical protein
MKETQAAEIAADVGRNGMTRLHPAEFTKKT